MSDSLRLVVFGAGGRMGQAVVRIAAEASDFEVVAALTRAGSESRAASATSLAESRVMSHLPNDLAADVLVDFSGNQGFDAALEAALANRLAFVSGSTGLDAAQQAALQSAAKAIPTLWAANFSVGVAVLARLAEVVARWLPDWDCEIVEAHHRHKRDAPSGTALMLGDRVAAGRGGTQGEILIDRSGARREGAIGYAVMRAGDIVGEHEVRLAGPGERIELIHRAGHRDIFARGALNAARWLAGRAPGRYAMDDLIGTWA